MNPLAGHPDLRFPMAGIELRLEMSISRTTAQELGTDQRQQYEQVEDEQNDEEDAHEHRVEYRPVSRFERGADRVGDEAVHARGEEQQGEEGEGYEEVGTLRHGLGKRGSVRRSPFHGSVARL